VSEVELFKETVWDYYAKHARELPWRNPEPDGSYDPYKILVSELMLQQTQVQRVIPKYQEFLKAYFQI
jgi:A/G-specific adenine glycosylase